MNLGDAKTFQITVEAGSNFSGKVKMISAHGELDALPGGATGLRTSYQPATFDLTPNCSRVVTVTVETDSRAPILDPASANAAVAGASHFHPKAVEADATGTPVPAGAEGTSSVNLKINAVFQARVYGTNGMPQQRWSAPWVALFRNNGNGGVRVNFTNYDTASKNIIHCNGSIPHQPTSPANALAAATAPGQPGGTYSGTLSDNQTANCYIHGNENSSGGESAGQASRVYQTVAPTALIPRYTPVISQIMQRSCTSCHNANGAAAANGIYTSLAGVRQDIDLIIDRVQRPENTAGYMPQGKFPLSPQDIQYLKEWRAANFPN